MNPVERAALIAADVARTAARPLRQLPASWWDETANDNIAAWLRLFGPEGTHATT